MRRRSRRRPNTWSKLFTAVLICGILTYLFFEINNLNLTKTNVIPGLKEIVTPNQSKSKQADNAKPAAQEDKSGDTKVDSILVSMTLEQKVGQLVVVGFSGYEPDYYVNRMINLRHVGGVILFGRNIKDSAQVGRLVDKLQSLAEQNGDQPLFVAIDQEWGPINRFKQGITYFPGATEIGKTASPKFAAASAKDTAKELRAMGININFAPVVDLSFGGSIMNNRSYGKSPELVGSLGKAAVLGSKEGGVIPTVKHFPGLGRAMNDPHNGPVKINASLTTLEKNDLVPFKQAIDAKVDMVMVSNALYTSLDDKNPACFSSKIQNDLLRNKLGFKGIVVTDDLEMGAALSHNTVGRLAVQAIKSGSDLLLICHSPEKQKEAYEALLNAAKTQEISEKKINESVRRILKLKFDYNLHKNVDLVNLSEFIMTKEHKQHSDEIMANLNQAK